MGLRGCVGIGLTNLCLSTHQSNCARASTRFTCAHGGLPRVWGRASSQEVASERWQYVALTRPGYEETSMDVLATEELVRDERQACYLRLAHLVAHLNTQRRVLLVVAILD